MFNSKYDKNRLKQGVRGHHEGGVMAMWNPIISNMIVVIWIIGQLEM